MPSSSRLFEAMPSATITSFAAKSRPSSRRMRACLSSTRSDCTDPSMKTAPAAPADLRLELVRARPSTMNPRFGSPISAQSKVIEPAPVGAPLASHTHMRSYGNERACGNRCQVPHNRSSRCEARLSANTRRFQSAAAAASMDAAGSMDRRSAMSATRPGPTSRRAPRRAAMVAPMTPAPITATSKSRLTKRLGSARRARAWVCARRRPWRAPRAPPSRAATDRRRAAPSCAAAAPVPRGSQTDAPAHR